MFVFCCCFPVLNSKRILACVSVLHVSAMMIRIRLNVIVIIVYYFASVHVDRYVHVEFIIEADCRIGLPVLPHMFVLIREALLMVVDVY